MKDNDKKVMGSSKKRLRKPKCLEFIGWGSRNLIEFLQSFGLDTTNRISENEVTRIIMNYIREKNRDNPSSKKKKRKTVPCDKKLHLLFDSQKINLVKISDLVEKHYVENRDDSFFDDIYNLEGNKQHSLFPSDKVAEQKKQVVQKPKGIFAAIVSDNIKLLYLRESLVQELAKTPETFENKMMGTFVRIKNPCQLVQVIGVKEGNLIDGYLLQVTNYSYYLKDYTTSGLSDDNFSQEECEELHQRIKNGFAKRLTVVDMEEKALSLHEDVTKHWIARELVLLQRLIDQANEKGWRRELSQYLEKRELLQNPEEQFRLLREVPEVVAEELEPECLHDDGKIENDLIVPNPEASIEANQSDYPVSNVQKTPEAFIVANQIDEEQQPSDSIVSNVQKTPEAFIVANQIDEEQQPSDSSVYIVQKTPEASIEANQSDEQPQLSDSPVSTVQKTLENSKLCDGEDQPTGKIPAGNKKDLHEDAEEQPANDITQNKDSITEGEMNTKVSSIPVIDRFNQPQAESNPLEIIELSDDDEEEDKDNQAHQHYDLEKVMWFYEYPKGKVRGPFSLTDLKKWNDAEFFINISDFKVWKAGESKNSAVLLTKLLLHIKT